MPGRRRGVEPVATTQAVEGDPLAVVELDGPAGDVERDRTAPEAPVEPEVVEALAPERRLLGLPVAGEELLRQRRAVIRQVVLGADHHEAAVVTEAAQLLRRAQAREGRADDGDGLRGHGARSYPPPGFPLAGTLTPVSSFRARRTAPPSTHAHRPDRCPVSGSHARGDAMSRPVPLDVSGRPLELRDVDLDVFLHPKSVAIIGASETPRRPNTQMTRRIKEFADQNGAAFYPVHPVHETVLGVRCYPTIGDIPGDVDLAVILTGRPSTASRR